MVNGEIIGHSDGVSHGLFPGNGVTEASEDTILSYRTNNDPTVNLFYLWRIGKLHHIARILKAITEDDDNLIPHPLHVFTCEYFLAIISVKEVFIYLLSQIILEYSLRSERLTKASCTNLLVS